MPRMVPGTLGMMRCKNSPEMHALKQASLSGTLMPLTTSIYLSIYLPALLCLPPFPHPTRLGHHGAPG